MILKNEFPQIGGQIQLNLASCFRLHRSVINPDSALPQNPIRSWSAEVSCIARACLPLKAVAFHAVISWWVAIILTAACFNKSSFCGVDYSMAGTFC
jgi:hypothetical protein